MNDGKIDLTGLDKAEVLASLYNASRPLGMGMLHYTAEDMSKEEAQKLLDSGQTWFDYLKGRVMKIDLSGYSLSVFGYDRDNGQDAALRAIQSIN